MPSLVPLLRRFRPDWLEKRLHCLLCGAPADNAELPLCPGCDADLPWLGGQCTTCALPLPSHGLACGECLKKPPPFSRVETPWRYAFPVDSLVTRFKHHGQWPLGRLLGLLLARHLQHAFHDGLPRPDLLLPVPLAPRRQRQRGFNQAAMLADWLGSSLQLPVDGRIVQRVRETPAQQGLDAATRKRNLRNAFALPAAANLHGLHLALVDDVLTTGATAARIAQLLRKAGAARVDVYCLARTPKPD
ncbi:DNA utilization protein GntX [compost metagenome]